MNLLIPSLALAFVALLLLVVIGRVLGGHASSREPDSTPPEAFGIAPPRPAEPLAGPHVGAPVPAPPGAGPGLDSALRRELEGLLARGQVIQAIKRYREEFDVGLKEAKEAVDRLRSASPPPAARQSAALGTSLSSGDPSRDPEVLEALAAGKKILAIKRYRELTGLGLKESKDAVESIALPAALPEFASRPDPSTDPELLEALAAGKKILAIKRYRELTGAGLKDSKEAVERM